jgi:hypothetical protein
MRLQLWGAAKHDKSPGMNMPHNSVLGPGLVRGMYVDFDSKSGVATASLGRGGSCA